MISYYYIISFVLIGLSFLCYLFKIYGWRQSLLISGVGLGMLRIIIDGMKELMKQLNEASVVLIWTAMGLFAIAILITAVGAHLDDLNKEELDEEEYE